MSDAHKSHTGPIKNSRRLPMVVVLAFIAPVAIIISMVYQTATTPPPASDNMNPELATALRIQPLGSVAVRDGNRVMQSGSDVYRMQCAACHDAGLVGAPKFGAVGDWTARLSQDLDTLVNNTLKGKGAMGPQGGGAFSDFEIKRAVVHLANAGGASFEEPAAPEAASQ